MKVSRFENYSEQDVETAYNNAWDIQPSWGFAGEGVPAQDLQRLDGTDIAESLSGCGKGRRSSLQGGVALSYLADNLIGVDLN